MFHLLLLILALLFGSYGTASSYAGGAGCDMNDVYDEEIGDAGSGGRRIVLDVDEPDKPAMKQLILTADCSGYYIENVYDIDYLVRDTVGMVGVPVNVYNERGTVRASDGVQLTFVYDEERLTCDEDALIVMRYDSERQMYDECSNFRISEAENKVIVDVDRAGTYVLEDGVIWSGIWSGTYVQEPQYHEADCHWHDEFYYQDIERLADTSIYDGSGEYHITTAEQFAGLTKLVNEGCSFSGEDIYLDADLDLQGFAWVPIGWYYPADNGHLWMDFPFDGHFYGQNHVIYNLKINAPDHSDVGLFGRTLSSFSVSDLGLVNCEIIGDYCVGAFLGDNINSGEYGMINCFATGTVKGALSAGALVGSSAYLKMKDCYAYLREGSVSEIAGDLRGGSMENCHLNDEESRVFLESYISDPVGAR